MRPILCGALLAFATLSPAAYAQSAQAEDSGQWSGRAQFGLSQNSGTTDFVALTIENDAKFDAMKL
ncbi:MAG: hypothetical protein QF681_15165, partial [Vicinamibacterales bacterium]|nr:hypothetical protein [Vicinamibacterales bacterium]